MPAVPTTCSPVGTTVGVAKVTSRQLTSAEKATLTLSADVGAAGANCSAKSSIAPAGTAPRARSRASRVRVAGAPWGIGDLRGETLQQHITDQPGRPRPGSAPVPIPEGASSQNGFQLHSSLMPLLDHGVCHPSEQVSAPERKDHQEAQD